MPLYEYSWFIERVRRYMEDGMNRDTAVTLAIKDCIREGIFAEFVTKHGPEESAVYEKLAGAEKIG